MILVIVGDIDPATTIIKVKAMYAGLPKHASPARPEVQLQPVKPETFTLDSNPPYTLAFISDRLSDTDSPEYAAMQTMIDVLSSQRGDL